MSRHTPGPWRIEYGAAGYPHQIVGRPDNRPGAVGRCITRGGAITLPSSVEGLANAQLIAAAPSLLKELVRLRDLTASRQKPSSADLDRIDALLKPWRSP